MAEDSPAKLTQMLFALGWSDPLRFADGMEPTIPVGAEAVFLRFRAWNRDRAIRAHRLPKISTRHVARLLLGFGWLATNCCPSMNWRDYGE